MVEFAPYDLENPQSRPPTLGLVVLQSDETIEDEFRNYLQNTRVQLYHTRIESGVTVSPLTLQAMESKIKTAVGLFPPEICFNVIGYACTSASTLIGEKRVEDLIISEKPKILVTNPATAAKSALKALGINRVAILTPYTIEITYDIVKLLETEDFLVPCVTTFNEEVESKVARIKPESILAAVEKISESCHVDAIFISCTNLRCARIITEAERRTRIPVLSSNLTLLWHMLQLAGLKTAKIGKSRLLELPISDQSKTLNSTNNDI